MVMVPAALGLAAAGALLPRWRLPAWAGAAAAAWWWWRGRGGELAETGADAIRATVDQAVGLPAELAGMVEAGDRYALSEAGKLGAEALEQQELIRRLEAQIEADIRATGNAHPTKLALLERYRDDLRYLIEKQAT